MMKWLYYTYSRASGSFLFFLMVVTFLIGIPGICQSGTAGEYQVKAAFMYHFATFVEWPSSTFTDTKGYLRICILGNDPFGKSLDATFRTKKIDNHKFEIHRNPSKAELSHCHLLYLTASQSTQLRSFRKQLSKANVLTVGENDTFIRQGGMIKFFIENQKIRFAINPDAINQTNLKVSSKLLRLAKIITP
jgi:hypothetical protein